MTLKVNMKYDLKEQGIRTFSYISNTQLCAALASPVCRKFEFGFKTFKKLPSAANHFFHS